MSTPFTIEKASTPFRVEKREGAPFVVTLYAADIIAGYVKRAEDAAGVAQPIAEGLAAIETVAQDLDGAGIIRSAVQHLPEIAAAPGAALAAADARDDAAEARDQALLYAPATYETTDPALAGMMVVDRDGRIVAQLPDPRVAALIAQTGQFSQTASFETTDPSIAALVLDAGGRVSQTIERQQRDPALTDLIGQSASFPTAGVYETLDAKVQMIVLDAGGRVAASVGGGDIDPTVAAALVEIATARGTLPVLADRLASIVTLDGAPANVDYRPRLLRQTHYLLAKRALPMPEPAQVIINVLGDSWSHAVLRWIGPYMDMLAALYGDAGGGWCGFGFLTTSNAAPWTSAKQPNFIQGNVRPATYPTCHFGSGAGTYYTAASPDLAKVRLTQAGDMVVQAFPALPIHDGADLFFIGTGDGVVSVSWGTYLGSGNVADPARYNFGGAVAVPVQGTVGATQIVDIKAGMPAGAGMLKVEWSAGTVDLCGVNLKSSAPGVRVNKLAATGSNIGQWAAVPAGWETAIAALGAHLSIAMDGTNSQSAGMSAATWGGHLATLIGRLRAAVPAHDILIATPAENQRANAIAMTTYAREARRRAMLLRTAYIDMQDAFGDPANVAEYNWNGPVPLFANESPNPSIHPNPTTGGRALLAEFLRVTKPF